VTEVTARRDGELGAVPVAPAAGSVKRSTEKISVVFLARRTTISAGTARFSRVTSLQALVHGVGFNQLFCGGENRDRGGGVEEERRG
jgi:hypothetical protein